MPDSTPGLAVSELRWQPCFRIIASRYPTIDLFERVADPEDWEALYHLEALTNPRIREQLGQIELVPRADRVFGPGASVIMAPFTHLNPAGSRFADATFGVFYASESQATAIAETRHHRELFLGATKQPPTEVEMRCYLADVIANVHDIRGKREELADLYNPDDYSASQPFGRKVKDAGIDGIVYDSVRRAEGQCVAIFRPRLITHLRQSVHLSYRWNGERIDHVYEVRLIA